MSPKKSAPKKTVKKLAPVIKKQELFPTFSFWFKNKKNRNVLCGGAVVSLSLVFFIIFAAFFIQSLIFITSGSQNKTSSLEDNFTAGDGDLNFNKEIKKENNIPVGQFTETEFMTLPGDAGTLADLNFLNSPDGSKFAYVVKKEGQSAVLLNGELGPFYDEITFMSFSPDSLRFAYGARIGSGEMVVLDGVAGKLYDWIFLPRFFTPDSKYFVYKTRVENGDLLVFNEIEGKTYEQVYNPFVSEVGDELIYYSRIGDKIYRTSLKLQPYEK